MKSLILSTLVFGAVHASAAQFETCVTETNKNCGRILTWMANLSTTGTDCSIVQGGQRETDGTAFSQKVIFKDANTLFSVETDSCKTSRADIYGKI